MSKSPASNIEWRRWGKRDPLFGVAAVPGKERDGAQPWTDADFYAAGATEWKALAPRWQAFGLQPASCVEIGCGAGRMTMQLAGAFQRVHAVDVSEDMIAYARERVRVPNVEFHVANGFELPLAEGSITAAFSTHVFQHFDTTASGYQYFAELARVLASGGTLMIHLPVHRWPGLPWLHEAIYQAQKRAGLVRAWGKRVLIQLGMSRPIMRYVSYSMPELFERLPALGFRDVEIAFVKPIPETSVHPFLFARRV